MELCSLDRVLLMFDTYNDIDVTKSYFYTVLLISYTSLLGTRIREVNIKLNMVIKSQLNMYGTTHPLSSPLSKNPSGAVCNARCAPTRRTGENNCAWEHTADGLHIKHPRKHPGTSIRTPNPPQHTSTTIAQAMRLLCNSAEPNEVGAWLSLLTASPSRRANPRNSSSVVPCECWSTHALLVYQVYCHGPGVLISQVQAHTQHPQAQHSSYQHPFHELS